MSTWSSPRSPSSAPWPGSAAAGRLPGRGWLCPGVWGGAFGSVSPVPRGAWPGAGRGAVTASGMLLTPGAMASLPQPPVTSSHPAVILPAVIVMGLGFGMIFAVTINTATAGVRSQDAGVASALVNTMQQVGGSIGLAALSPVAPTPTASYPAAPPPRPQP